MRALVTLVADAGTDDLHRVDTVEYMGEPWLVAGGWFPADDNGYSRPISIIRPIGEEFHAGGQLRGQWGDYVLSKRIDRSIIAGAQAAPPEEFEIVDAPDVRRRIFTERRIGSGH